MRLPECGDTKVGAEGAASLRTDLPSGTSCHSMWCTDEPCCAHGARAHGHRWLARGDDRNSSLRFPETWVYNRARVQRLQARTVAFGYHVPEAGNRTTIRNIKPQRDYLKDSMIWSSCVCACRSVAWGDSCVACATPSEFSKNEALRASHTCLKTTRGYVCVACYRCSRFHAVCSWLHVL